MYTLFYCDVRPLCTSTTHLLSLLNLGRPLDLTHYTAFHFRLEGYSLCTQPYRSEALSRLEDSIPDRPARSSVAIPTELPGHDHHIRTPKSEHLHHYYYYNNSDIITTVFYHQCEISSVTSYSLGSGNHCHFNKPL